MKKFIILILVTVAANIALAQLKHTVTKSSLTYKIKNLGFNTDGSIGGLTANIKFSADKPESSSMEAMADVNTINSDNNMRDKHLKGEDYFDVARYPKIAMKSTSIKRRAGNNYIAIFNVTIKDKTKSVDVPFTYTETGNTARFKGSFKIQRTDFGVGNKGLALSNEVTVFIDIDTTTSS